MNIDLRIKRAQRRLLEHINRAFAGVAIDRYARVNEALDRIDALVRFHRRSLGQLRRHRNQKEI